MVDILHKVGIKSSSLNKAYAALTTLDGLSAWWTSDTRGEADKVGGVIEFCFGNGGFDMKVLELDPGKRVLRRLWIVRPPRGQSHSSAPPMRASVSVP